MCVRDNYIARVAMFPIGFHIPFLLVYSVIDILIFCRFFVLSVFSLVQLLCRILFLDLVLKMVLSEILIYR